MLEIVPNIVRNNSERVVLSFDWNHSADTQETVVSVCIIYGIRQRFNRILTECRILFVVYDAIILKGNYKQILR